MSGLDLKRAETEVRSQLRGKRLEHTLEVERLAARLAQIHQVSIEAARFAGLLHDWAKGTPEAEFRTLVARGALEVDPETLAMPQLYHAYLSAYWIETRLGVCDPVLLDAVRFHSTGAPGLNRLGQVVLVADYAEPTRQLPQAETIRQLALEDLQGAVREVLRGKLRYLIERGRPVHSLAWRFWNALSGDSSSTGGKQGKSPRGAS